MKNENPNSKTAMHVRVDQVAWRDIIHIHKITSAATLAFQPNRMIMGLIFITIIMVSGTIWDAIMPLPEKISSITVPFVEGNISAPATLRQNDGYTSSFKQAAMICTTSIYIAETNLLQFNLMESVASTVRLPATLAQYFWTTDKLFLFIFGGWFIIIWCIFSTMICRSAACDFAVNQQIPWTEALAFSLRRWMNTVGSFALPAAVIISGLVALGLGGLLFHVPVLNIFAAILYGLALFGGFIIVSIIILTILGSVLFIPAVAVESADATDALARGFSYVKNRPLHFVLYMLLAIIIGLIAMTIVGYLAQLTLDLTSTGAQLFTTSQLADYAGKPPASAFSTSSPPPPISTGTPGVAAAILSWWGTVVGAVVAGFIISYLCSAQTVIYFLMRKATDDQALDEIWVEGMIEGTLAPERLTDQP